jgi:hypothetical protein
MSSCSAMYGFIVIFTGSLNLQFVITHGISPVVLSKR